MHSKQKGNIGELSVCLELSKRGLPVFKELGDLSKVDLITIVKDRCIKIQVKNLLAHNSNNSIPFTINKSGPNYSFTYGEKDVDVFAILLPNSQVIYIGWKDLGDKTNMVFRIEKTKNGQTKGVNYFEDFLDFDRVLKQLEL